MIKYSQPNILSLICARQRKMRLLPPRLALGCSLQTGRLKGSKKLRRKLSKHEPRSRRGSRSGINCECEIRQHYCSGREDLVSMVSRRCRSYAEKPHKDCEDPRDVQAICEARETIGDLKLKTDKTFTVPKHLRMSADRKKVEMINLEDNVNHAHSLYRALGKKWCVDLTSFHFAKRSHAIKWNKFNTPFFFQCVYS